MRVWKKKRKRGGENRRGDGEGADKYLVASQLAGGGEEKKTHNLTKVEGSCFKRGRGTDEAIDLRPLTIGIAGH